jgi:hypothetical protein
MLAAWPPVTLDTRRVHHGPVHQERERAMAGMDDQGILRRIHELVDEERRLRDGLGGRLDTGDARRRLRRAEETLDQCWDLLRQRRAREEFGQDAGAAAVRPVSQVEGYLQ